MKIKNIKEYLEAEKIKLLVDLKQLMINKKYNEVKQIKLQITNLDLMMNNIPNTDILLEQRYFEIYHQAGMEIKTEKQLIKEKNELTQQLDMIQNILLYDNKILNKLSNKIDNFELPKLENQISTSGVKNSKQMSVLLNKTQLVELLSALSNKVILKEAEKESINNQIMGNNELRKKINDVRK